MQAFEEWRRIQVNKPGQPILRALDVEYYESIKRIGFPIFLGFTQVFVPAGRSYFAYFAKTLYASLAAGRSIDFFMATFGEWYEGARRHYQVSPQSEAARSSLVSGFGFDAA